MSARKNVMFSFFCFFIVFLSCYVLVFDSVSHAQDTGPLRIATYGGEWGDAFIKAIYRPFEEKYGVKVLYEPANAALNLSKLRQEKDNPTFDIVWLDMGISELALNDGLLEFMDPKAMPNLKDVVKEAVNKTKAGEIYSVTGGFYSFGIGYNTEKVKDKPISWLDLWKDEFAHKVTAPSPNNTMGNPFLILMAQIKGGDINNVDPGIEMLRKLKVAAYFDTSGQVVNMFQSGEIVIGGIYHVSVGVLIDRGLAIKFVVPKEGVIAGDVRLHIVKGTKHKGLAEKLINFAATPEAQKVLSENLYLAPINKKVTLNPKARERMPYGATGSLENLKFYDFQAVIAKRDELMERWNKEILIRK